MKGENLVGYAGKHFVGVTLKAFTVSYIWGV